MYAQFTLRFGSCKYAVSQVHIYTFMYEHTQHLPSSSLFISSPNSRILGLPCTALILPQTVIKAFSVHFSSKHVIPLSCIRIPCNLFQIWFTTINDTLMFKSCTMALIFESIASINQLRNWPRTCLAAWNGKSRNTQLVNYILSCMYIVLYHSPADGRCNVSSPMLWI